MDDLQPDIKAQYNEGCNAVRHYSLCVMNMRTVTIAQGIVILSAAIYLINQNAFHPSLWLCGFGLLFTGILYMLQKSYWEHFETILEAVVNLETIANKGDSERGPWSAYRKHRTNRFKDRIWRLLVRHGPFLLLLAALLGLLFYNGSRV